MSVEEEWEILSNDELRRRALRYKGVQPKCKPPIGEKSTILRLYDLAFMAKIDLSHFHKWLRGVNFGHIRRRRLSRVVLLCDAGMVTKHKHTRYTIHDKPVEQPIREMRVTLGVDGVGMTTARPTITPATLPNFNELFKGIK